ncbi:hypothetical protein ACFQZQ_13065 [Lysobacter koreensis]|uniref:Secreted protein n=1 Tax=Lysobacter koreensis TaxID=266122 RepID=A0ABW2YPD9_9GAMM
MKLIALCYFVLSLFGCDVGGSSFVNRTIVDGSDVLYSRASSQAGVARFDCLRSASGQCHYTVFAPNCAPASGPRNRACRSEAVERFAIAKGDTRLVPGLHRFGLCVSTDDTSPGPDCEMPRPIAAR